MNEHDGNGVEDEMLMALADGELDGAEAEALRRIIDSTPELAARYEVFAKTASVLRHAFAQDDVPARLIDTVRTAPTHDAPGPEAGRIARPFTWHYGWPAALAASLVVGMGLGWGLRGDGDGLPTPPDLQAVAEAVSDLATGQVRDVAGFGQARVLGSFQTAQGLCRLIVAEPVQSQAARFVACRDMAEWRVAISVLDGTEGNFAPASAAATEVIDLYLDAIGAGPALSAQAEAEALR